jgi:hypothetical protein
MPISSVDIDLQHYQFILCNFILLSKLSLIFPTILKHNYKSIMLDRIYCIIFLLIGN